jgi:putative membrane protein
MELAAEGYDTFLGKPEGATGEVRFIIKLDGIEPEE